MVSITASKILAMRKVFVINLDNPRILMTKKKRETWLGDTDKSGKLS